MARMIPRDLRFEQSGAEKKVFAALRDALPDEYTVLHHVCWVERRDRRKGGGAYDGETDFVIVHPDRGVLMLEVKGGLIRYDAAQGTWFSKNFFGVEHELKDPFEQARSGKFSLKRWLNGMPDWNRTWGPFGYAVWFPDCLAPDATLPHIHSEFVLDASDVRDEERLRPRIDEALSHWAEEGDTLGPKGAAMVAKLAQDVVLRQPLGLVVDEAERQIVELTGRQYQTFRLLARMPRVQVSGPAGSGKTLLAAETARRLAEDEGRRTLLTCYNHPLADFLRESLRTVPNLQVDSYNQLCYRLARRARIPLPAMAAGGLQWNQMPATLARAADRLGAQYDAIVVDEAQDFAESWWPPLQQLLQEPDASTLHVFYDDNQALYHRPRGLPPGLEQIPLFENLRNAKPVFDVVAEHYRGSDLVCLGPHGPDVRHHRVPARETIGMLGKELTRLIRKEEMSTGDLVVLSGADTGEKLTEQKVGSFTLTPDPAHPNDVRLSTVHRFKGLDAPAVIVYDIDPRHEEDYRKQMYVAASRARVVLIVIERE